MSLPREVLPQHFYLVTRRCTQRQFLLRPDDATNNAFIYCLIEAAQRCGIDVLLTCAMSNHHHTVIFDRAGRYPEFIEHFHKMMARSQNALRGRRENLWASEQASVVRLITREAVIDKLVYTATNPVKDFLVERVHHWPGVNGLRSLLTGRPLRATRPRHFFRATGATPAVVEMQMVIPEELGTAEEIKREVRLRASIVEADVAAKRKASGQPVYGRRNILRQSWRSHPTTPGTRNATRPRIASRNKWAHIEAAARNRDFVNDYMEARGRWLLGTPIPFPPGTYWLNRFADLPVLLNHARLE